MSNYTDIVDKYVSVFVPENASEEVRKDVERAREAIGSEIASSSSRGYLFLEEVHFLLCKERDGIPSC